LRVGDVAAGDAVVCVIETMSRIVVRKILEEEYFILRSSVEDLFSVS
jgi:hypothetical protein